MYFALTPGTALEEPSLFFPLSRASKYWAENSMMLEGCYLRIYLVRSAKISWNPWGTGNCCKYLEAMSSYNFYKLMKSCDSACSNRNNNKQNKRQSWNNYKRPNCTFSSWKSMFYIFWSLFKKDRFFLLKILVHLIL